MSVDGPIVNIKLSKEHVKPWEKAEPANLIDINTCGLHVVLQTFKNGTELTDWNIKKVLQEKSQLLHDYPTRRKDYISVTVGCFSSLLLSYRFGGWKAKTWKTVFWRYGKT